MGRTGLRCLGCTALVVEIFFFFFFFKTLFIYLFRGAVREGKRKGEKHQCERHTWLPLTWPTSQEACALTGN